MKKLLSLFAAIMMSLSLFAQDPCGSKITAVQKNKVNKEVDRFLENEASGASINGPFRKKVVRIPVVYHVLYTDYLDCNDSLLKKQIWITRITRTISACKKDFSTTNDKQETHRRIVVSRGQAEA
jgi:hypothetical protein